MSLNVVSFFRQAPASRDWTSQELAEFYRVEASLIRGGVTVETDRGLSDEGDPWFVFCRADTGDVIIHFARTGDDYVVASPAFDSCVRGRQFRPLIEGLIESHPLIIPKSKEGAKFFVHPAALLVALVATCFFKLGHSEAAAAELKTHSAPSQISGKGVEKQAPSGSEAVVLDERQASLALAAIATAVAYDQPAGADISGPIVPLSPSVEHSSPSVVSVADHLDASAPLWPAFAQSQSHNPDNVALVDEAGGNSEFLHHSYSLAPPPLFPSSQTLLKLVAGDDIGGSDSGSSIAQHNAAPPPALLNIGVMLSAAVVGQLDHAPTAGANSGNSSSSSSLGDSLASQEVVNIVGGSLQQHLVIDESAPEPQLVLSAAAPASTTINDATQAGLSSHSDASSTNSSQSAHYSTTSSTSSAPVASTSSTALIQTDHSGLSTSSSTLSVPSDAQAARADAAIASFISAHPDFQMMVAANNEVIMYDPHLSATNIYSATEAMYTFSDGSSVVLIGIPPQSHYAPIGA
jgi:hypothetical protein